MQDDARVVVTFNDAINRRDLAALSALMTDGHRFIDPAGSVVDGKPACVDAWRGFFASFPDYRNVFDDVRADGAGLVEVRGRSECSTVELAGPAVWRVVVRGGLVEEWRVSGPFDVAGLGTILGVWAHPDDEAYLSGGLMAIARDNGSRVVCVTATRGELGTPEPETWPPERLAAERTDELARCLEVLGVTEHHWLGYRDGGCAEADASEAVAQLCEVIERVRPDTVLTFGPDGITGHADHQTISAWTTAAFNRAAPAAARLLYAATPERRAARWSTVNESLGVYGPGYPVTTPDARLAVDLVLDPNTLARKVRALVAQATQTTSLIAALGIDQYTAWVGEESFVERS
jgi:LmbE family N-acetylglucosaminyl deacetylase